LFPNITAETIDFPTTLLVEDNGVISAVAHTIPFTSGLFKNIGSTKRIYGKIM
jgi:hypothetical protein